MQFIEKNSLSVRSAVYHCKKDGAALEFILFPMIHIGEAAFFEEVSQRLGQCDMVLMEGVKSKKANLLTLSYRIVRHIKRLDLVTQHEGMNYPIFRHKVLPVDLSAEVFDSGWAALPFTLRVQIFFLSPIYAAYLFFFGTREIIAENMALEDLPSSDEAFYSDSECEHLDELLLDKRDARIIEQLQTLAQSVYEEPKIVGLVYGAAHLRAIAGYLFGHLGYRVVQSEWVKVFNL